MDASITVFSNMAQWTLSAVSATSDVIMGVIPTFRMRPSWNLTFGTTIKLLRTAAYNIYRDFDTLRYLTDNAVPRAVLPSGVDSFISVDPRGK
jgi:hypothetical protein